MWWSRWIYKCYWNRLLYWNDCCLFGVKLKQYINGAEKIVALRERERKCFCYELLSQCLFSAVYVHFLYSNFFWVRSLHWKHLYTNLLPALKPNQNNFLFSIFLVFAFSRSYAVLFLARALQGVGSSCSSVSGKVIISDVVFVMTAFQLFLVRLFSLKLLLLLRNLPLGHFHRGSCC